MAQTTDPTAVNKFETEHDAVVHAKAWSKDRKEEWSVVHGLSEKGLMFFVERGDGGMIRNSERLIGTWCNGKKIDEA